MLTSITNTIDHRNLPYGSFLACNLRYGDWSRQAGKTVQRLQLGELDTPCSSQLDVNMAVQSGELPLSVLQNSMQTIRTANQAIYDAMKHISVPDPSLFGNNSWNSPPVKTGDWSGIEKQSQTCDLSYVRAFRVNSTFYIHASITNHPLLTFVEDYERHTIEEYVSQYYNMSLNLKQERYPSRDIENTTTLLTRWSGAVANRFLNPVETADNPALVGALRLNEKAIDQAEDALTVSNIAILALPMVMSLIPLAFLADMNACGYLWYIIFTDIFSALPFLIKGIELIKSADVKHTEVFAYHAGSPVLSQVDVWAVKCQGEERFRSLGIAFIIAAAFSTVLGIGLELYAGHHMMKRRGRMDYATTGPFGEALFKRTAYGLLGKGHNFSDEERYSRDFSEDEVPSFYFEGSVDESTLGAAPEWKGKGSASEWWRFPGRRNVPDEERVPSDVAFEVRVGAETSEHPMMQGEGSEPASEE